ncbi:MAG: nucleoside triphosphate pyrophosphohydrolase [Candidatus Neomarinimicrobiota bacterium]|nr:MAG: nucleoside triphosphate pyrophosphohydrolase [Candidatus Neomarinimicrobiota bacterium]
MSIGNQFESLIQTVERLRAPDGCPWDREQTSASLLPYFLEEIYEVMESVDHQDWNTLKEELGDVLLHVVMQGVIAAEQKRFTLEDSLHMILDKLIRRHPHVFGDQQAEAAFHAKQNWEREKHKEKGRKSRLDGVPPQLPALLRAQRLQQKAAYAGFDWKTLKGVWEKVEEEIDEVREAMDGGIPERVEEEIGDILFSVVNLARFLGFSAEDALRKTNEKFIRRFQQVEAELQARGKELEEATLEEMDAIWNSAKGD